MCASATWPDARFDRLLDKGGIDPKTRPLFFENLLKRGIRCRVKGHEKRCGLQRMRQASKPHVTGAVLTSGLEHRRFLLQPLLEKPSRPAGVEIFTCQRTE